MDIIYPRKTNEELMNFYLPRFKRLINDWSNEIPDRIIHSPDQDNKYKCRIAWFSWFLPISEFDRRGIFSDELSRTIQLYQGYFHYNLILAGGRVTHDLIEVGESILSEVISVLEERLLVKNI